MKIEIFSNFYDGVKYKTHSNVCSTFYVGTSQLGNVSLHVRIDITPKTVHALQAIELA